MASLTIGAIAAMVSAAASVVSLAMTLSMKPKGPEARDSGASIDRKGQNNPKVIPFGRCLVPGVRVWNNVNNMDTKYLAQVYSFGVGPIKEIEQIYIDGVNYFGDHERPSVNHWYGIKHSGEFPNVMMGLRAGQYAETTHSQLIGHSDGEWTTDHRGDRIASAGVLVERWINKGGDNDVRFISDRVKLEAMLHGNAVIDPRFSMFERNWVNEGRDSYRNPACVLFTYLVDTYYGLGLPIDVINVDDFIELANYCDGKNFTFDGYIDQDGDFGSIILDMCTSFDGIAYVEDGKVRVKADKLTYPVCHIDEDDMVGSFRLSNTNDSSYFNVVNVEFVNENANHTVDKYVIPKDVLTNPTVIADGFEKTKDIKLMYTSDNGDFNKIRRIANKHLRKARYQQTIEFEVDNTRKSFKVYDVIEVTNSDYGLDKKQFRVVKIETTLDDKTTTSKVVAEQYEPSVYDEMNLDDGITSPPVKPPTTTIPSPVGLKFELTGFSLSGQGKLSWTTRYNREGRSVVEYKLASSSDWKRQGEVQLDEYNFNGLRPDTYDFRVMTRSFVGSTSQWTELNGVQIKGGLVLPTVTGMKSVFTNETCIISWDDMKVKPLNITATEVYDGVKTVADVFSHYEVIVYKGDTPKYTETLTSDSNVFTYTYDMNVKSGVNRSLKFEVRVVAVDGSEGNVASVTAKNAQAEQASGVQVSGKLVQLNARWDQPKDQDFAATDIHISSVSDFTPSASTLVETTTGGTVVIQREYEGMHYLRVGHYDKFGKDGMTYSAPQGFVMQDIDDLLENSPSWESLNNKYTLKVDTGNKVAGIMIGEHEGNSYFDIVADKFRVSSKAGDQAVFQVNANTGETIMRNALIKDLTATNIKAGSITGNSIASNTKIVAGGGNASASLDGTGEWRIYAGHTNGASAPFRVYQDGRLFASGANIQGHIDAASGVFRGDVYANNGVFNGQVNASSGTFNGTVNAHAGTFNNVTIAENCQVLGTLYADRIIGLPVGTRFSQGESGWSVSSEGNWVTGMALPLPNPQGRFTVDMMFGGRFELEHVGIGTYCDVELIRDGQVISSASHRLSGNSGWQPISSFSGIPISCGNHGGTISLRIRARNGQGKVRFRWLNGYMYTAIANPAFWES